MSIYSSKGDGPEALNEAEQSEKRLRSVLDGMTDAYYVLDREWRFAEIDRRAPVYFGCPLEELAGRCIWELYPQYEGSKTWEEYHRAVSENVPVHFETQSASGGYFFEVHAYPQPDGLAVYLRDITGRKKAEEALRENERKYERLIKYAPAAIYEIDFQKNRFISVNDAMCLMSGYSREELLTMDPFDIISEQSRVAFKKRLEQWLKDDEPISQIDYLARAKDGREAWFALNVSFTRDENGAPLGAMSVAQDISDRKQAEERIKLQNTILQAINKAYEQYVLCGTLEELRKACLDIIEEITGSAISFIGEIGKDGLFHDTAISTTGWEQCEMFDSKGQKRKTGDYPIRGLYGSVLRNAKTLMTNDPGGHMDSRGVPEGHIALTAFLGVPFIQCGHVTGMAAVANRNGGYTENEKEILEAVTPTVCEVLLRKRAEEALRESEERFHSAAKNSSFEFSQFDTDLRYLWIDNPQMDLEPSQILRKRDIDLEDSEGMLLLYDLKRQVVQNGKSTRKEICFNRKDGLHTYDFFIDPVFENRKIVGGTSLALDITKHKKEQEDLVENKERLNALMDNNPSLVFLKDEEGRYVYINKAYEMNFASGSWYGKTDFDFWPKESAELFRINDANVLNSGQTMQFMEDSTDLEGKRYCWLNYKFPFTDSKNRKYIGGIGIDATRLILAEEALHDRSRELEEANRQNADILESISDCFYALDKELRFVYVNKRAEEIWGMHRADLIGRSIEEVFKGLIDVSLSKFRIAMEEQTPQHYELYSRVTDRWGEISVYPTRDGVSVYFRDITESKRAEEALRESEGKLRAVIEGTNNIVFLKDTQSRLIMANNAYAKLVGKAKSELIGRDDYALYDDKTIAAAIISNDNIVLSSGKPQYFEEVIESTEGLKTYLTSKVPYRDEKGQIIGIVGMAQDITERKRMEEALRESEERTRGLLDELAEADRNKNEFLSALSHELRNPLGAISAGLQLMDITSDEKQARTAKEIMNRQMDQLCHLVDDLLDLTRITNNKITLKRESVDINKLIRLYINDYRPLFDKKQIKLKLLHSGGKLIVNADPVRVKQITGNLLHNASKFTNKGGEVKLSVYEEEGYAVICVKDSGIGIKPSDLPKLFEPFAQIDSHIDRAKGGLGLGLSIVRAIARLHGGDAEAESAGEGQGASFYIRLPLEPAGKESKTEAGPPAENAGKLKVLLIEDNKDYSDMLCSMLRILGHEAVAAFDGAAGLKAAGEYLPDVIICDIGLPGMNGYEVAKAVMNSGMVKRPYMAALSGYARPQDIEAAMQAGFDRHIAKPVTLDDIKQILGAVRQ